MLRGTGAVTFTDNQSWRLLVNLKSWNVLIFVLPLEGRIRKEDLNWLYTPGGILVSERINLDLVCVSGQVISLITHFPKVSRVKSELMRTVYKTVS